MSTYIGQSVSEIHIIDCVMVDQIVYFDILKKTLTKFIEENHESINEVLFRRSKASIHYASFVTFWLESERIVFVSEHDKPPKSMKVRPM